LAIYNYTTYTFFLNKSILAALTSKHQGTLVKSFQLVLPPLQGHASEGMSGGVGGWLPNFPQKSDLGRESVKMMAAAQ
jgi:hypothetical protein